MATIRSMARRARTAVVLRHGHHVLHVAQRIAQLLERDHLHVPADGVLADGLEDRVRGRLAEAVQDARLGRDAQPGSVGLPGVADHALGRQDVGPVVGERHRLAGATALGMDQQVRGRVLRRHPVDVLGPDAGMDVALAHPDGQLATRDPLQPEAQEHVRQEQDLAVGGDGIDDRLGVARRAAIVRLCLHRRRGVDIGHDHRIRVLRLPGDELLGGDGVGQRAARVEVRDEHRLLGAEHGRGLGHEMDAAERDDRGCPWSRPCATGPASRPRSPPRPGSRAPGSGAPG